MKAVIALGGNAILLRGERGTAEEQFAHVRTAVREIVWLIARGDSVLITHGNGPQVGDILLKNECARDTLPIMPLDICGAESQGMIGYMIQQSLENALAEAGIRRPVISVVTQTVVDPADPAFADPKKPIGPFYTEGEAALFSRDRGWMMAPADAAKTAFRRVVPSPEPLDIVEHPSIRTLVNEGFVVVAGGGGGIPVRREREGALRGVEAVVDKDLAAERLATGIGAEMLLVLTDVPSAFLRYGTPDQEPLGRVGADELETLLHAGHFPEGSMGPKVRACIRFVREGGEAAVITSLDRVRDALAGTAGTRVVPS
ncbi:MAG: carbamate kinase [Methanoculleus sp. SDB]|nr:MAG: carbamate kinase [Methanoculleus sp. SDB]